ncbi:MAG: universal stress protein, partial [Cyclobacteriaceae bacterium]
MVRRIVVLVDFSEYSEYQLLFAQKWAEMLNAEILLLHKMVPLYMPSMADAETRDDMKAQARQEIQDDLQALREKHLSANVRVRFIITDMALSDAVQKLHDDRHDDIIFLGLKGGGLLKKIFIGSTTIHLIDQVNSLFVTVPKHKKVEVPEHLLVSVHYRYPLYEEKFDHVLRMLKEKLKMIKFISICSDADEKEATENYLKTLCDRFNPTLPSSYAIYPGKDAFSEIKRLAQEHQDWQLVIQRGSRAITDHFFRRFFINE